MLYVELNKKLKKKNFDAIIFGWSVIALYSYSYSYNAVIFGFELLFDCFDFDLYILSWCSHFLFISLSSNLSYFFLLIALCYCTTKFFMVKKMLMLYIAISDLRLIVWWTIIMKYLFFVTRIAFCSYVICFCVFFLPPLWSVL